jgi:MFS transporter, putative metabolite:H+ symporter
MRKRGEARGSFDSGRKALTEPKLTVAQRIEQLPLGRFHQRFVGLVSLGNFFDLYDIFIVAYLGAALQQSGFLTLRQFTVFVAAGFLGMFVGTVVFGMGSDRMGRRSAFIFLLLIYSIFTFADAFAPNAKWLIALRFFAGVGIGAEIVVIDTYVTEVVPSYARGRYVAITQIAGFCAVPVAAMLSRALVPTHWLISGWRWVMVIGASGALLTWWFRRRLPESPRWLEARGRVAEAETVMAALESESFAASERSGERQVTTGERQERKRFNTGGREVRTTEDAEKEKSRSLASLGMTDSPAARPGKTPAGTPALRVREADTSFREREADASFREREADASFRELWKAPYLSRTVMLVLFQALQTIGFYGFANWAPTFLLKQGVSLLHSLEYTLLIAVVSPVGPLLAAWTSDRLERKWTIVTLALLVAGLGLGFGNSVAPAAVVGFGALLTLANYWFSAAFHAYQAELFPTRLRATGVGFTYSWSRLSAAFTSLLIGWVLNGYGVLAVFAMLAVAMTLVAVVIGAMGPRTNRMVLEEISG